MIFLCLLALAAQDEARLRAEIVKGQKFSITTEIEFVGNADLLKLRGPAKIHARLEATAKDAETLAARILEFSGKGFVTTDGSHWSYDLEWRAGIDFGKTVIGHTPAKEAQQAAADLDDAYKTEWTVKSKALQPTLEGKTDAFTFLKPWAPNLFLLPSPLPFGGRDARKGQGFEDGGFTWTVDDVKAGKDSRVAIVSGKTKEGAEPRKTVTLGIDSRGFVASLEVQAFQKGIEGPALKVSARAERLP
jgi:hypothetical protein